MGLGIRDLWLTKIGNEFLLTASWKPEKKEDGRYWMPLPRTPIGLDMCIPSKISGLNIGDEPMPVKIVKSDIETGLWLICYNDYFGNEQHLYNYKPRFIEGTKEIDSKYDYELMHGKDWSWQLHVSSSIEMKAGDGPIPVTLVYDNDTGRV